MKILAIIAGLFLLLSGGMYYVSTTNEPSLGAATVNFQKDIVPIDDSTYSLGTALKAWLSVYTDQLCLSGDCRSSWPTGGSGGGDSTLITWNTSTNIISTDGASTTATTSFTTNGITANSATITNATSTTGWFSSMLRAASSIFTSGTSTNWFATTLNATNGTIASLLGTNATITSATTTNLRTTQFGVGSDYITDLTGTGLSISGGALTVTNDHSAVTLSGVRDYITLVGQDIVRGVVDISDDTNLTADGTEIVLTGDALSLGTALTFTSATATNLASTLATTSIFYGAGLTDCDSASGALTWDVTTGKFGCNSITGGSGGSNWTYNGSRLSPSSTVGIGVFASSTIGGGTGATGLFINGGATTTGNMSIRGDIYVYSGDTLTGSNQWNSGDQINGLALANSTIVDQAIDFSDVTLADFTNDAGFITATNWLYNGSRLSPSTTVGIGVFASSTLTDLNFTNATGTNATTTNFFATLGRFTTASSTNASTSILSLYQRLYDRTGSAGTNGMVLQTNGSGVAWVATSTLGLGGAGGGTVTSVDMTVPTGFTITGNPVTTSGTLGLSYDTGYSGFLTASGTNWNGFYDTPSTRITAGANCSWAGNTFNCTGGSGGSISTSSVPTAGNLAYWTSASALSDVATGTLTETVSGLELSATRGLVGGSSILSLTSGFVIPSTTPWSDINNFYNAPSFRISDGTGLTWSSNTLNCDTASGSTQGCLTSSDWTLFNQKVSPTSIDTSSELAALLGDETGTGNAVFSASPTFTGTAIFNQINTAGITVTGSSTLGYASSTALTVSGNTILVNATTTNIASTLSTTSVFYGAGLTDCDTGASSKLLWDVTTGKFSCGTDQTGGAGGSSNWILGGTGYLTPSTSVGISVAPSSTISLLSSTNATITAATTTNLATTILKLASDVVSDITGFGLALSSGALGLDTTGAADGECLKYSSTGPSINWDTCGGGGSSKWTDGGTFTYLTDTPDDLVFGSSATSTAPFWWDVSATTSYIGNGGAGDSVVTFGTTGAEWTLGFDDTDDSFRISSSTSLGQYDFLTFSSTSTLGYNGTSSTDFLRSLRVRVGTLPSYFLNGSGVGAGQGSHFFVNGLIESSFSYDKCNPAEVIIAPAVDTAVGNDCDDAVYSESSNNGNSTTWNIDMGNNILIPALALYEGTALHGVGYFFDRTAQYALATTTPRLDVLAQMGNVSTSTTFIGFSTNGASTSAGFSLMPNPYVGFFAASTTPNWQFTVRESDTSSTTFDTGVATATVVFLTVQSDAGYAYGYIGSTTAPKKLVNPGGTPLGAIAGVRLAAGAYFGRSLAGNAALTETGMQLKIGYMELWRQKPYMFFNY